MKIQEAFCASSIRNAVSVLLHFNIRIQVFSHLTYLAIPNALMQGQVLLI